VAAQGIPTDRRRRTRCPQVRHIAEQLFAVPVVLGSMLTPGQLIRQHRTRRGWSQRELALLAGITQAMVSQYENEHVIPTWQRLCRVLAPMGVQPTMASETCDVSAHSATTNHRQAFHEWFADRRLAGPLSWEAVSIDDVVRPHLTRSALSAWDVGPVCHFVDGLDAIFVGPFALRMHGLDCTASRLDLDVYEMPVSTDEFSAELARRLARDGIQVWSPRMAAYVRRPAQATIEGLLQQTAGRLTMRTDETGTEIRFALCPGEPPTTVTAVLGSRQLRILALEEFDRDLPWVKHVVRDWIGPDEGSWPAGPGRYKARDESPQFAAGASHGHGSA
jgi:transcriptional regulator with XRE-family HTH domain